MHLPLPKVLILPALLAALLLPLPAAAAPVSLHFVDADLATVLRAAARLGGYGLVLDGAVDGRVTIDTEAEPALFLPQLARMYGLAVEQQGTTFYISAASHRNAQRRPYVFPVRYGAPERLATAVNLSFPAAGFEQKVTNSNSDTEKKENRPRTAAQSSSQGRVTCDADSQSLIFYGTPDEAEAVRELLRTLDVPARQVSLEAKVVSLSKDASRELGVEWNWSALPQTPEVSESWETRRHITTTADGKRITEYEDLPKREVRRTFRGGSAIPGILQFGRGPEGYPFEFYYEANLHALVSEGKAKLLSR
ncbi:MAG: pilus assembly protein PilQ, partial [Selenomonas bovis]|nr:pilus assembly protein PilQ [Selenomonas bovis]